MIMWIGIMRRSSDDPLSIDECCLANLFSIKRKKSCLKFFIIIFCSYILI
jgi:hypothetical protein